MRKLALLLLVSPLALVACGGGSHSAGVKIDPLAYVKRSAAKTAGLSSEHMTLTATVSAAGQNISMHGSGDYTNSPLRSSIAMQASVMGRSVTLNGVQNGTTLYMSSPIFASELPAGKTWVELDLAKYGKKEGFDVSSLMSRSPAQALQQVEAAGSVKTVGSETIDGVPTTHYQVTNIDVSKLPQGSKIEAALGSLKYGALDVWIGDKDGYIYRESASYSYSADGQTVSTQMTEDLSKFGENVTVHIPPASQTVDATKLGIGGFGG